MIKSVYGTVHIEGDVAIKKCKYAYFSDRSTIRELAVLKLNQKFSPKLISIDDFFKLDITMKNCGISLTQWIKNNRNLDENIYMYIFSQITEKVYDMYKFGIYHCDLKPDNILIHVDNDEITITIIDYGIIEFIGHHNDNVTIIGTSNYIKDTYYNTKIEYNDFLRSYMHTLGTIFYELLTGTMLASGGKNIVTKLKELIISKESKEILESLLIEQYDMDHIFDQTYNDIHVKYNETTHKINPVIRNEILQELYHISNSVKVFSHVIHILDLFMSLHPNDEIIRHKYFGISINVLTYFLIEAKFGEQLKKVFNDIICRKKILQKFEKSNTIFSDDSPLCWDIAKYIAKKLEYNLLVTTVSNYTFRDGFEVSKSEIYETALCYPFATQFELYKLIVMSNE